MIDPTKLLRGAVLALALLFLAPLAGVGGTLLGVEAAQAATVSKITVVGNKDVETARSSNTWRSKSATPSTQRQAQRLGRCAARRPVCSRP